jgi:hypothetical protein
MQNTTVIRNFMIPSNHMHLPVAEGGDRDVMAGDIGVIKA